MKFAGIQSVKKSTLVLDSESSDSRNETIDKGRLNTRAGMSKGETSALGGVIYGLFTLSAEDENSFKFVIVDDELRTV